MLRIIFLSVFSITTLIVNAQTFTKPSVPDVIDFAGMKLELTPSTKRKIEADVTMIYSSGKFLQQKIDRANLYFPIIEHVFHQEGFPEEFKYLALQESSLVSDAVSSSNAVGFWQFKKETAIEVGMTVNSNIDERKHISYASKGAATYIKKNNLLLNNWVYALLSYNVGPGGVKTHVKTKNVGAKNMVIDDDIHWYVIRFLAYKIAYQDLIGKANHPDFTLIEYKGIKDKSLQDISKQSKVDFELLKEYNKWCTNGHIPNDKEYIVIVPTGHDSNPVIDDKQIEKSPTVVTQNSTDGIVSLPKSFPDIRTFPDSLNIPVFVSINKVKAIRARNGDDINALIIKTGLSKASFMYFNELKGFENVTAGDFYYMQLKRAKALVSYHTVEKGETIHSIAQKYAITIGSIKKHNRLAKNEHLQENRIVWLRSTRPKTVPVEYKAVSKPIVKETKPKTEIKTAPIENAPVVTTPNLPYKPAATHAIYHVVKSGETVFGISRMYGIDSDSIRVWNQLSGYSIQLNQKLIVGYKNNESKEVLYVVKAGDTVYKISKQYNVAVDDIKKWNNLPDYNLTLGQQLKITLP